MSVTQKFNLATMVPVIHNAHQLSLFLKDEYIINEYMRDDVTYTTFTEKMMNLLRGSYTIKNCRDYPIKFRFNRSEKESHVIPFKEFMVNLILWYPFVELNDLNVLNKSFILDYEKDIPKINDYINYKIITVLRDYHVKSTTINYACSVVLYNLRTISLDFSLILGLNFSMVTFLDLYKNNPEIRDIMEVSFDDAMQPHDIEQKLHELEDREIDIFKSDKNNPIGVILRAGTGIKHKQLTEFTISEGLKPTIDGKTVPIPINNSTILRGLDRPSYIYLDATGARKSLVLNKKVMGRAGYFGKIVLLLARTLSMTTQVTDCGTKHLVEYEVKSKDHLKKLNGKFFKETLDDFDYKVVKSKKDTHLIGKKIYVRSAATCALGDCVCARCVGLTATTNYDISDGLSAFESEEVTKVVNQSILSTKHLLTTNSEIISFNKEFYNFFTIMGGEINPLVNNNDKIDNVEEYAIYIDPEDIIKMDEQDYDSLYNTCICNGRFYIRNIMHPEQEDILIQAEGEKEIFLTEDAIAYMKSGKGLIYFKEIADDVKLFEMTILNKELTKPLYDLMNLLNKLKNDEIIESIDSMSQKFLDLLIESRIDANSIASELIINRLIRSCENIYDRPDFAKEDLEPYKIYTVSKALEKNRSPLIGISFQNLKRQFLSDELYEERTGSSFIDPFYMIDIPTDNLKQYSKIVKSDNFTDFDD